jgi:osmotically-inducible protein OsmY
MFKLLLGAAAGFAAAWFLDSNDGARRRNMARDKAMKYIRQGKDEAVRTAGAAAGPVKGAAAKVTPGAGRPDAAERLNDPALQAKVESEIFRAAGAPKDRVSVNVEEGIVYLRGELPDRETIDRLRDAAEKVDGVSGVESLLHEPGEPAPTKDHSASASS